MDENATSKDLGAEGKKDEQGRRQPVKIHELLGLPKSTGKSTIGNASMMQSQRSQPVLVKDLFKSTSSCKKPHPSGRRMTLANGKATNVRRQLYETSVRATPESGFSTNAETIASGLHGNAGSQAGSRCVQLGGSKSEGKFVMNGGFRQPERVKNLMESWEKSQSVKRQARKSVMGDLVATKVRRKLYNAPSPVAAPQIVRKSLAPSRLQNPRKSTAAQRKSLKPDQQKSSQTQPRRSCIPPPNSIRDKHVKRQQNDTIKEESPASLLTESDEKKSSKSQKNPNNEKISPDKKIDIEIGESVKNRSTGEKSASNEAIDEAAPRRPTVIMAASSTRKVSPAKKSSRSPRSSDKKSPFALSRRASFKQLERLSFPKHRLDATPSSIEDLLGNSRPDEPSIGNLPCNSFLEQLLKTDNSRLSVDEQTVQWMRANLKLAIQSTEENLFAMKKILRALDDLVDDESSISELPIAPRNDEQNPGAARIEKIGEKISEKIGEKIGRSEKIGDAARIPVVVIERCFDESAKIGDVRRAESELDEEENKENVFVEKSGRRRSARLAARSPKNFDDSFSAIEKELNIVHEKSKSATPRIATPRERKKIDPRSRRSMREYMALKSMVNCLQTPDVKGAPTPRGETKDLTNQIRAKRSISRTLMNELDDLYADSPL